MIDLRAVLESDPGPDLAASQAVADRASRVLRPVGALRRLDEIASWLAAWQRKSTPAVEHPSVVVFVADHGVTEEGVSAYSSEVTASVFKALQEGVATAPALAQAVGAHFQVVDAGVGNPTANFADQPALDWMRFQECFELGRSAIRQLQTDLLVVGETGIGNTTSASAITACLLGCGAEKCTGRGSGADDETLQRKVSVVQTAVTRVGSEPPLEILRQVGGCELVAMAGAVMEARLRSIPVVLDGFVATAAVAPFELAHPGSIDHTIAGHLSPEPGHALLLDRLGKQPILDLQMRLGEGSGAIAALSIIRLAAAGVTQVATFEEWGLEPR